MRGFLETQVRPSGMTGGLEMFSRLNMPTTRVHSVEAAGLGGSSKAARPLPTFYIFSIAIVIIVTSAISLRRDGIFACPASGYDGDYYLGYCQGRSYGDYDHGAFWFALETAARDHATAADILFVGNSRMQFGFSAPALQRWSATQGFKYYLLGFSHVENATFIAPLLSSLKPAARAYVINLDQFFVEEETLPGRDVMHRPETRTRYVTKQTWQAFHRVVCSALSFLCGWEVTFYRQRNTGEWRLGGSRGLVPSGVGLADLPPASPDRLAREAARAAQFIANLGVERRCIILTYVPTRESERATAEKLASTLGFDLIAPDVKDLRTFDGSHLDPESAERFTTGFLAMSWPRLRECLK